jgi:PGDYG protein
VQVGEQRDPLRGEAGDWLLQYGPGDYGVVASSVFEKTYEPA